MGYPRMIAGHDTSLEATLLETSLEGEAGPAGQGYATDAEPMEAGIFRTTSAANRQQNGGIYGDL